MSPADHGRPAGTQQDAETQRDAAEADDAIHLDARDARGAEIVLRGRRRRAIFIAGLAIAVALAVIGMAWA